MPEHRGAAIVLTPAGPFGPQEARALDAAISAAPGPVVIDLSECALGGVEALLLLDPSRWGRAPEQICVACSSASTRERLRCAGVHEILSVFATASDALQARRLADDGYGRGWSVR